MLPRITPITPARIRAAFDDPEFIYELKHGGFRCVAYIDAGACELVSRKQNVYKSFAPVITRNGRNAEHSRSTRTSD